MKGGALHSLKARLLAGVIGVASLLWLAAAVWIWHDAEHELDELLDAHLAQAAALLVAPHTGHEGDDDEAVLARAPLLHRYAPRVVFQVWHDGLLIRRSGNAPQAPLADMRSGFATREVDGQAWRVFAAPGTEPDVQIYVGELARARRDILGALLRGLLLPMAVALGLTGLGVWWAVKLGLQPLVRLRRELEGRQAQSLAPVAVDDAPLEIAPMVQALNSLFARIAAMVEAERRFTADAAHELRTPLAAIRAQAQVAHAAQQAPEREHALDALLAGCDRAARLVDQLLMLARLQTDAPMQMTRVDLCALARQVAADLSPMLIERGQDLELHAEAAQLVYGEPTLLAALLRNLLDNASRYGARGTRVAVSVEALPAAAGVQLRVEDSGPGLDAADLARLGERFFRVLGSGETGSGLGWSIVRRIAQAHGAEIVAARSTALGGLSVTVTLPATRMDAP